MHFISAITGGLLSLFLGFSMLTLLEIFYFITIRLACSLQRKKKIEIKKTQSIEKLFSDYFASEFSLVEKKFAKNYALRLRKQF